MDYQDTQDEWAPLPVFEDETVYFEENPKIYNTQLKPEEHTTKEIRDFIKNYPNSTILVSCKSSGMFRLEERRDNLKYSVAFIPCLKDAYENNK